MPWPQTGATQYHVLLGLPDKGRAIKGLVVCNSRDLEPLDLLNSLALGCYQPYPEVLIVPGETDSHSEGDGKLYLCVPRTLTHNRRRYP